MSSTVKVIVGRDGVNLLGEGRARLLELVEERRSLRKAAMEMGMSYRYAWGAIKHLEESFGYPLVSSRKGGRSGGSSELTEAGRGLLDEYRRVHAAAVSAAGGELMRVTVVLAARDGEGRFASIKGHLPRGRASLSEPPEVVLERLIEGTGVRCKTASNPVVRTDPDEGLLLLYSGYAAGPLGDGILQGELGPEDRELLGDVIKRA